VKKRDVKAGLSGAKDKLVCSGMVKSVGFSKKKDPFRSATTTSRTEERRKGGVGWGNPEVLYETQTGGGESVTHLNGPPNRAAQSEVKKNNKKSVTKNNTKPSSLLQPYQTE